MLGYRFIIFSILVKCVVVLSKNQTTYTFDPRISQIRFLSLPKSTLFPTNSHRNSTTSLLRNRIQAKSKDKIPDDEERQPDEFDEVKNSQRNQEQEDQRDQYQDSVPENGPPEEEQNGDNQNSYDSYNQGNNQNDFTDQSTAQGYNGQDDMNQQTQYQDDSQKNFDYPETENNSNYSRETYQNPPQESQDNSKIVEDISKEEQMKDMNSNAGDMLNNAKDAKAKADELLNQYKEGTFNSETNHHTLPKDEAGNIIITNTTATPTPPPKNEEKVDPLKSIRDATLSLYERAKHKNLPVSDPTDLSTPEQIYNALNTLEYIIDGYRYTKIDLSDKTSPDQESGSSESSKSSTDQEESGQIGSDFNSDSDASQLTSLDEGESLPDTDRFLQVKKDEDDEDEQEDQDEEQEAEEGSEGEEEEKDEENEDFHKEESEDDSQKKEKKQQVSPHQAMEDLRAVLLKLSSTLEKVVEDNTGVKGVIMRESVKVE